MPFVISDRTKARLAELMSEGDGSALGYGNAGGFRSVIHVKVMGEPVSKEDPRYECKPLAYDARNKTWEQYAQQVTCWVYEANEKALKVGDRYLAVRYGEKNGEQYYVCDNQYPLIKCFLKYEEDPDDHDKLKLNVDVEALAGDGLDVDSDSDSGTCDPLKVKDGCGIIVDATGVSVDVEGLAGDGLTTQAGDYTNDYCDKLKVNAGCGLRITDDDPPKLALDLQAIAFTDGLYGDNDLCVIGVNAGCGLGYQAVNGEEKLIVDVEGLAGPGLKVKTDCSSSSTSSSTSTSSSEECCPQLEVNAGCGLKVKDGQVQIDKDEQDGPTFSAVTAVSGNGCGLTVTTTAFKFKTNECGVFLGFEQASTSSYTINLKAACCDCDSDSDSSSDSDSDSCVGGWTCVNGVCTWVEDCGSTSQGECPSAGGLTATVTPDGCDPVNFTLGSEGPGSWTGDAPMGSCACPGMPAEYWNLAVNCNQGNWLVTLAAPTGSTSLSVTVNSTNPISLTASGTMTCEGSGGQYTFPVTVSVSGPMPATAPVMYATLEECELNCQDSSSDSDSDSSDSDSSSGPPWGWSCLWNPAVGAYECQYVAGGVFATQADCLSHCDDSSGCVPGNSAYYCTAEAGCVMIDACDYPAGYTILSGPHYTAFCCDSSSSAWGWSCVYSATKVGGPGYECQFIEGGLYATQAECQAHCDTSSGDSCGGGYACVNGVCTWVDNCGSTGPLTPEYSTDAHPLAATALVVYGTVEECQANCGGSVPEYSTHPVAFAPGLVVPREQPPLTLKRRTS